MVGLFNFDPFFLSTITNHTTNNVATIDNTNKNNSQAKHYKEWNMKEMKTWLRELENGRYQKYIQKLIAHATIDDILPSDIPDLTDVKLEAFGIDNIEDRLGLRYQFQKLKGLDIGEGNMYRDNEEELYSEGQKKVDVINAMMRVNYNQYQISAMHL